MPVSSLLNLFWLLLFFGGILGIFSLFTKTFVLKNWRQGFEDFQFKSGDFYTLLTTAVERRKIPDVYISTVILLKGNVFTERRMYLRISRGSYIFDVCAAPFGTSFFVSYWFAECPNVIIQLLRKIKFLARLIDREKTYFQIDEEAMFTSIIHNAVLEAIDHMTSTNGLRSLSELERKENPRLQVV